MVKEIPLSEIATKVRCYDNGGPEVKNGSIDRYTVIYLTPEVVGRAGSTQLYYSYVTMNSAPFHPQGFGQHGEAPHLIDGHNGSNHSHLGKRILFTDLPPDCQQLVRQDLSADPVLVAILKLDAGLNLSGNGRRLWVGFNKEGIARAAWKDTYGSISVPQRFLPVTMKQSCIRITAKHYRELVKQFQL